MIVIFGAPVLLLILALVLAQFPNDSDNDIFTLELMRSLGDKGAIPMETLLSPSMEIMCLLPQYAILPRDIAKVTEFDLMTGEDFFFVGEHGILLMYFDSEGQNVGSDPMRSSTNRTEPHSSRNGVVRSVAAELNGCALVEEVTFVFEHVPRETWWGRDETHVWFTVPKADLDTLSTN
ncbi:hypothetical protein [uncultured Pelagimonas sp.]|uniref:hypothetical protein n=1 Tax=uncultured Pelagimonas sp. TaxID=1618102 RepID=UPI002608924F|nr:hypothetical protein [uncultured Pelagimonas sp.]